MNTHIRQYKNVLVKHINILTPEVKDIIQPILNLGFHQVYHVNKTCTQG